MPSPRSIDAIRAATAARLHEAGPDLSRRRVTVGFDGFVDSIIAVVDKRHDARRFDRVATIAQMAAKIAAASDQSSNYELVVQKIKLGGNGPILANALASLGLNVAYLGAVGYPHLHPVFRELADKAEVHGIAEPGQTDALEFDDGKLMLGKYQSLDEVDWEHLVARVGVDRLSALLGQSGLVAMVNWTMLPHMTRVWENMIRQAIVPPAEPRRRVFVDLADPEKRTPEDLLAALRLLAEFQRQHAVTLGLNLKESAEVASAMGLAGTGTSSLELEQRAAAIRSALQIECVVIHPRKSASAATATASASFPGPFVGQPVISTGAGDHFNAGFCLGELLNLTLEETLCCGVAVSGYYVRTARSPNAPELASFIAEMPLPAACEA